ncbi:hypothetical protein BO71DRAFT_228225 [Aspergillus ellipticus CBS 707.79]|uniref:Uncharacterized protein n=1 Tax=Aspergillus ellipticus CBS 707.79 TaxID=1448320 RepID=A0A319E1P2_9EURO|nr:hypothetical protein BO71DRAFT_228225 [Aspergillus ellipticus CBS 707.79]
MQNISSLSVPLLTTAATTTNTSNGGLNILPSSPFTVNFSSLLDASTIIMEGNVSRYPSLRIPFLPSLINTFYMLIWRPLPRPRLRRLHRNPNLAPLQLQLLRRGQGPRGESFDREPLVLQYDVPWQQYSER